MAFIKKEIVSGVTVIIDYIRELVNDIFNEFNDVNDEISNIKEGVTDIKYDNNSSLLNSITIKDAIDEIAKRKVYSLEEKKVGVWVNNKVIYRKVFVVNITEIPMIIGTITNVDTIISMIGTINYSNGLHQIGAYANTNFYSLLQYDKNNSQIKLFTTSGYVGYEANIIIEYTKNTES